MKYDDKDNKVIKSMGFADFETYHQKDFEYDNIDVRVVGNELHVFKDGKDTGERPSGGAGSTGTGTAPERR